MSAKKGGLRSGHEKENEEDELRGKVERNARRQRKAREKKAKKKKRNERN